MSRMVTPDEMFAAAKDYMLAGREPEDHDDFVDIMNFFALNLEPTCALPCCQVMNAIYNMGLTEGEVDQIVAFQLTGSGRN
jgi:hypothetical protein